MHEIEGEDYYVIPDDYVVGSDNKCKPNLRPGNIPIIHGEMTEEEKKDIERMQEEMRPTIFTNEMQEKLWQKFKEFVMKDKRSEGVCRRDLTAEQNLLQNKSYSKLFSTLDRANKEMLKNYSNRCLLM